MLSFLYPAFLIGAAAAAVPLVLHLLKRHAAPEVRFSAVRFLRRAPVEQARRRRLRELLLLSLRVAALVLLALAFARPYMVAADAPGSTLTVVAIDRSFSMGAPARWDRARALAREAVDAAPGGAVAVLAFDDGADLIVEPTNDRSAAARAIDGLAPGFGGTRYAPALARAAELIGRRQGGVVVVTDLQRTGWGREAAAAVAERIPVAVADVGVGPQNLAVLGIHREAQRTVVTVSNGGREARQAQVRLAANGRPFAAANVAVEPGASADVVLPGVLPEGGVAVATVADAGGAPGDDTRYVVLDPPPASRIVMVTSGGTAPEAFYLERALAASSAANRFDAQRAAGSQVAAALDRAPAAVVLLATRTLDRQGREALTSFLEAGGGLLAVAGGDVDPAVVGSLGGARLAAQAEAASGPLRLSPVDPRHPIFRPFAAVAADLGQIGFRRAWRIGEDAGTVVARFSDGTPALVERQVREGRLLVFGSDVANRWNDFPLHPTFVPFVHEAMRYLVRARREPQEYLIPETPEGLARTPGIASIGTPPRRVAVNVDPAESDPSRLTTEEFEAAMRRLHGVAAVRERDEAVDAEAAQSYWRYGLVLMLATLVAEGLVATRVV
jgi:hypothetical protein